MSRMIEALITALVRCAARTAPDSLAARLEEEWLADAHGRATPLSRLRFAVGCYWASFAIGLEHRPISVALPSTAQADASMLFEPPPWVSSRAVTLGLVLSLHAVVFCALMMAGTKLFRPVEPPAIQPRVIEPPLRQQIKPAPAGCRAPAHRAVRAAARPPARRVARLTPSTRNRHLWGSGTSRSTRWQWLAGTARHGAGAGRGGSRVSACG